MVMGTDQRYRVDLARRVGERLTLPRERVERILAETARLHQLCAEYEACRSAMERWRSIKSTGQSRLEEYEILSDDLEAEIAQPNESLSRLAWRYREGLEDRIAETRDVIARLRAKWEGS